MEKIAPLQVKKNINFIKVAFHTLGCKVNFSETSTISREFTSSHYQVVSFTSFADLYVINNFSVAPRTKSTPSKEAISCGFN